MMIRYDKFGKAISDFEVMNYVEEKYRKRESIHVSTENVIYAVRMLVKIKAFKHNMILFEFEDNLVSIDLNGKLHTSSRCNDFSNNCLSVLWNDDEGALKRILKKY